MKKKKKNQIFIGDMVDTGHGIFKVIEKRANDFYKLNDKSDFLYHESVLKNLGSRIKTIPTTHSKRLIDRLRVKFLLLRLPFFKNKGYYLDNK